MLNKNLEKILKKKKEKEETESRIDWKAKKGEWIQYVNSFFFEQVEKWLKTYMEKDLLRIKTEKIRITEENIGTYEIDQLIIEMPNEKVILTPVGTLVMGAKGRIDMQGNQGTVTFLLVEEDQDRPHFVETRIFCTEGERKKAEKIEKQIPSTTGKYAWKFVTPPPGIEFIELNEDVFSDLLSEIINE